MKTIYQTPTGQVSRLFLDMLAKPHVLLGGATGSGKSVTINGLIYAALFDSPAQRRFILIDPKRVELRDYASLPHTLMYASEPAQMIAALREALGICDARFKDMQRRGLREYDGSHIYVIIDELADLLTVKATKSDATTLIQRIGQIGRAARVHMIAATQSPVSAVIPTPIKVNFDTRVGFRTATAQDSRNIVAVKGCEQLPDPRAAGKGYAYYRDGANLTLYVIPMVSDIERRRLIAWWMDKSHTRRRLFA